MRTKSSPSFLSAKSRNSKTFLVSNRLVATDFEKQPKQSKLSKRKALLNEQRHLISSHPHLLVLYPKPPVSTLRLRTIALPLSNDLYNALQNQNKISLYFNKNSFLFLLCDDEIVQEFIVPSADSVTPLFFAASCNILTTYYEIQANHLILEVCLRECSVNYSDEFQTRPITEHQYEKIHDFLQLHLVDCPKFSSVSKPIIFERHSETQKEFTYLIKQLYDHCQSQHEQQRPCWDSHVINPQHQSINTSLRGYQKDAVKWMVFRERNPILLSKKLLLDTMFIPVRTEDDDEMFFCIYSGMFSTKLPTIQPPSLGGILADEMGLGKTLEVISLILLRPWLDWNLSGGQLRNIDGSLFQIEMINHLNRTNERQTCPLLCSCGGTEETEHLPEVQCTLCHGPSQHAACVQYDPSIFTDQIPVKWDYICPQCWSQIRIESKATLIVSPDHIWQQWKEEIQAHVDKDAVSVVIYAGMEAPVTSVELGVNGSDMFQTNVNPFAFRTPVNAKMDNSKPGLITSSNTNTAQDIENYIYPGFVQPGQLACADIVLTSYSVVQRELGWADVVAERRAGVGDRPKLRLAQRYLVRPSPLTCVRWWRICLDEAQMVERVTSKTARMLNQIDAVHRWCITGTPAEKSIDDLYGLFAYLRFEPFSFPHYWHCLLYQPFLAQCTKSWPQSLSDSTPDDAADDQPMSEFESSLPKSSVSTTELANVLSQILWRNTKVLVGNQLTLPPLTEQVNWISFSSVERYIYDRVLLQSAGALERLIQTMSISLDQPLSSLPGTVHWRLVYLITRLRQACTHASLVVASGLSNKSGRHPVKSRPRSTNQHSNDQSISSQLLGLNDSLRDDDDVELGSGSRPSTGSYGDLSLSQARAHKHIGTGCLTMTEVVRRVVDETRRECEGLLRTWVFNKNGSAGCFIIKQQYIQAADCYRDVLRSTSALERRHGILADWSQRLHAITNLHWLIQTQQVPLSEETIPHSVMQWSNGLYQHQPTDAQSDYSMNGLDPRVDRDLLAKAERLRTSYIQTHSRLLARVRDSLDPIVAELDKEINTCTGSITEEVSHGSVLPFDVGGWLTWLAEALDWLIDSGLGSNLIDMLVASFQSKASVHRSGFRTSLLYAGSPISFKAMLLSEFAEVLSTRERLRDAMKPLDITWKSFVDGEEVDKAILQPFYGCCARIYETEMDEAKKVKGNKKKTAKDKSTSKMKHKLESPQLGEDHGKPNDKKRKHAPGESAPNSPPRPTVKRTRCAYCIAVKALQDYQRAINHQRAKTQSKQSANDMELDDMGEEDRFQLLTTSLGDAGTGVLMSNPLIVSLSIIGQQISRLVSTNRSNDLRVPKTEYQSRVKRLDHLVRLIGKEILLTSRTQSLTKEWWDIFDDTEQFVVRLQTTSPTDLTFIHREEVDIQLQSYIVEAQMTWLNLQSRLGHFSFLRNAHLNAVTGGALQSNPNDSTATTKETLNTMKTHTPAPLECPTCLQYHSPSRPTFVLLPGCWHSLCIQCHDRIQALPKSSQRRCPVCRAPFVSTQSAGINARRRRPPTLIHYDGDKKRSQGDQDDEQSRKSEDEEQVNVTGDHSSKVQAVIRRLKTIKIEDPDAKAIVFSSWLSVLVTLAGALDQNNLGYTTLFQARDACLPGRLAGFCCPGSTNWILLMPVQLGANGLNLTAANHVLFVDPVLSHGQEAQAIARMHRIGQKRSGIVHRFLIKDSIEAALHSVHVRIQSDQDWKLETECMIGVGSRRTSSTSFGVAGPGEDRAQLMQMTIRQLCELLNLNSSKEDEKKSDKDADKNEFQDDNNASTPLSK